VAQVALAVIVLTATGLLARNLQRLQDVGVRLAADRLVHVSLALPQAQYADRELHRRFITDLAAQLESVRVRAMDADVAVMPPRRFDELLEVALARPRFNALLITLFGSGALFLAAIGLCAAMTAVVRERRREIAVRVALGATAGDVRRLVLGEGARLVAVGAVAGMAVAGVTTRVLQSLLFDVQPFDAVSWIGALFLITAVTMLALYLPVRQAARVDSASTLRAE
jgi:ABC-type antimicrobial peptide transport system permease subunit